MKLQLARAQALLTQKKPKPDPALKVLQPLLKRKDAKWPVFHYAGIAFIQKRDYSAACKMLLAALELGSNEPETYHSISICHFNLGAFDEAVVFEKKALERNSNFFKGWLHLGSVYRAQARLEEALKCFQKANQLDNSKSGIAYRIAEIYKAQGDMDKALELLNITIKMDRKYYDAWIDKAEILKIKEKFEEAEDCLNFVLAEKPKNLPARVTLAELFKYKGDYAKAIELYERLMEEYPKVGGVRVNYALCMQDLGQFDESEKNYLQALEDQPGAFESFSNYLMGLHYNPKRTKDEIFEAHLDWDHHFAPKERPERPNPFNQEKDKKLRIGFISGGFRRHPVGWMIAAGLENLPKNQFEVYCYTTNNTYDKTTERIYKKADKWQSVIGYKDEVIAKMIREDEIDILVELSGHSADTRLKTVVLEPAPVVVKWVGGLFNTTGLKSIDYLLTDWHETPAGEEKYYTEKLVRMPDDYICYLPPYYAPDVEQLPAKDNGYITFGCFNNPTKVNNEILEKWAAIMNRVPGSRLFLKSKQYDTEALRQRIIDKMGECGITEDRLLFEGQSPHNELLSCYNRVDIALDPWPYSGGLTTCEALWMGVPVITKPGPTFAGRHSATHLTNAGYSEWVTDDWDEYTEKAVDLAENIDALAELRTKMREQVANSPVCDGKRFGAHLAVALREMWKQRVAGYEKNLPEGEWQDHIEVKALSEEEIEATVTAPAGAANEDELIFDSSFIDGDDSTEAEEHKQHSAKTVKKETDDDLLNGVHTNGSSKPSAYSENGMDESLPEVFRIETKDGVTVCTPGDLKLLTPYVLLEQEEWFEPELNFVRNYLKPGMTALDIGAAFGVYSLPMAKITGNDGKVYAFEPGLVTRHHLEMSKVENHLVNLGVVGKAISDTPGQATYHVAETPELNKLDETGSEKVAAITLDSWWDFEGRPDIDFIKLDVNGAEAKALAGAENLLKNNDPVLLFAMAEGARFLSETIKKLSELQYNIFQYVPGPGLLTPFDAKAGGDPYLMNLIAVKDNRVEALKEDGFIHNDAFEPEEPEAGLWKNVLREQLWTEDLFSGWEKQSLSPQNKSYLQALDYLCAAEQVDADASPTSRSEKAVLLLGAAQILIQIYNSGTNSTSAALTLIRVLNALGKRGQTVEIMQKLIETTKFGQQNINTELPFLLPLPEQDVAAIQTDFSKWLMVRVVEAWVLLKDMTTYLSGEQESKLLKGLEGNPEVLSKSDRRIAVSSLQDETGLSITQRKKYENILGLHNEISFSREPDTNIHEEVIDNQFWGMPISAQKAQLAYSVSEKVRVSESAIKKQTVRECQHRIDQDGTDSVAFFILVNALLALESENLTAIDEVLLQRLREKKWENKKALYSYFFDRTEFFNKVTSPDCSVVIVSNKINDEVLKNLKEVNRQKNEKTEVIFVNNGLAEEVTHSANEYVDILIHLKQNAGACMARNFGALFSKGDLVIFLDDDGIPENGLINAHKNIHEKRDIYVARGVYLPKKVDGKKPWHYDLGPEIKPAVCFLEGNTSFRPEPFFKTGGWNDRLLVYHEGLELSCRYYREGYEQEKLIYFPDAVLRHDYIKPPAGQNRKNKLLTISHHLIHAMYDDVDNIIQNWPQRFSKTKSDSSVKRGGTRTNSRYDALKKVVYLAPGNTDMAFGIHNKKASLLHNLTLKEGVESEVLYLTDPQFLQKVVEISKDPGHAIDSGAMGYPSWVTIDRVQSANLFDLLGTNIFAFIGDHLFANFMWHRLEKMGSNTTFYTQGSSLLDELSVFGKNNASFLIENIPVLTNANNSQTLKKISARDIDVLVPWTINHKIADRGSINNQLLRLGKKVFDVGQIFIDEMKSDFDTPVLALFIKAYSSVIGGSYVFNKKKTNEDYVWMNMLHLVDQHVRHWKRFEMLKTLTEIPDNSKIIITAEKKNAEGYSKLLSQKNIQWIGQVASEQLNQLYKQSKIVMNCNPTYPHSLHGRVKNGMSWGCCVVSDSTPALRKRFKDKKHILFTDDDIMIADLVKDTSLNLQEIADNGREIMRESYTQEGYCRALLDQMNNSIR